MSNLLSFPVTYPTTALIPPVWLKRDTVENFRVYNPTIVRFQGRLLMAYRIDTAWRDNYQRQIGLCQLDEQLQIVPGSIIPFSETIREGGRRHYDPRFLVYQDRLFIHYNNNRETCPNWIYLVEVDPNTLSAKTPARPLLLEQPRQDVEKNWMLFEHAGELFAIYQICPHTILKLDLAGKGPIVCKPLFTTPWVAESYSTHYGLPYGGTSPVRWGDYYVTFFHSRRQVGLLRHLMQIWPYHFVRGLPRYPAAVMRRLYYRIDQRRYFGGVYAFQAEPPFQPVWLATEPVLDPVNEKSRQQRNWINPVAEKIVFPAGILFDEVYQRWLVSYGLHDERCCLRRIDLTQVTKTWEAA